MTIAELLAAHAANLKPANGDKAYSRYQGIVWEGTLENVDERGRGKLRFDGTKHSWWPHSEPVIHVGYDDAIRFDAEKGCFYAPADAD